MTDETMVYRPDAGKWTLGRPPTRAEAVMLAAECAAASTDNTISPAAARARAASAQAWAAVAEVAAPGDSPVEPAFRYGLPLWASPDGVLAVYYHEQDLPPGEWRRLYFGENRPGRVAP